jgi:hypothetical protein
MTLSRTDQSTLVLLLVLLQGHLESAIETAIVPGTDDPMPDDAANVARDRRKI